MIPAGKIPNNNIQITNKSQAPGSKSQTKWFVIWILLFGILLNWNLLFIFWNFTP